MEPGTSSPLTELPNREPHVPDRVVFEWQTVQVPLDRVIFVLVVSPIELGHQLRYLPHAIGVLDKRLDIILGYQPPPCLVLLHSANKVLLTDSEENGSIAVVVIRLNLFLA